MALETAWNLYFSNPDFVTIVNLILHPFALVTTIAASISPNSIPITVFILSLSLLRLPFSTSNL